MKKNILIFYISKYSGHFHAARAIEKALLQISENVKVRVIDALEYTNPILGRIINKTYLRVIKKKPEFWGDIYDNPDVMKKTERAREALHKFNLPKVKKLFKEFTPDVIYCTQAFPCGMIAGYKKTYGVRTRLIAILTDYAPHSYWLFDEVDLYVVPSEESAQVFQDKGVSRDKIKVLGIPVNSIFNKSCDRKKINNSLDFCENKPTVLIMGGSQGLGAVEESVAALLNDTTRDYQLMVVTGNNKKLHSRLRRLKEKNKGKIHIFSYVENVEELMDISDIVVTKAGGLTTSEALIKGLPMLVIAPIPGQERLNTDYLVEKGAAVEVKDLTRISSEINRLFDSEETLKKMRTNAKMLSKARSALETARLAFEG